MCRYCQDGVYFPYDPSESDSLVSIQKDDCKDVYYLHVMSFGRTDVVGPINFCPICGRWLSKLTETKQLFYRSRDKGKLKYDAGDMHWFYEDEDSNV